MLDSFIEDVDDLSNDIDDQPTQEAKNACGAAQLADVAYQASVLNAAVVLDGEGEAAQYEDVADAANAWLDSVGLSDEIDPFEPTSSG
jgi:hypothetical protein